MLFLNSWRASVVPYSVTTNPPLFKNSIDTQGKLRLNLHSLSVLLEYRRKRLVYSLMLKLYAKANSFPMLFH
jgi:hypothetical protein